MEYLPYNSAVTACGWSAVKSEGLAHLLCYSGKEAVDAKGLLTVSSFGAREALEDFVAPVFVLELF